MVNTTTKVIKTIYSTTNQSKYGPGVGAVTFSPVEDRVLFIHGIRNADKENPYTYARRTGVSVLIDKPGFGEFLDARNITPPFTPGALRGGTHAHSWVMSFDTEADAFAGYADVILGRETARYGGAGRFVVGAFCEIVASWLLSAATGFRTSLFLIGLPFGRDLSWGAQHRDAHEVSWRAAAAAFWPGALFGLVLIALLAMGASAAIAYLLPFVAGLIVAIPFAKFTASVDLGAGMSAAGLCATPEEVAGDWPLASGHDHEEHEGREDRQVHDALQ